MNASKSSWIKQVNEVNGWMRVNGGGMAREKYLLALFNNSDEIDNKYCEL